MYNSVTSSLVTEPCILHQFRIFVSPWTETPHRFNYCPWVSHLPFPSKIQVTNYLLSISIDLSILDFSYKLNHTICSPLWLASFSLRIILLRFTLVIAYINAFISSCGEIMAPLYRYVEYYLSFHQLMEIWVVSIFWSLWINPSINIHLCFCVDVYFQFSYYIYLLLYYIPGVKLLTSMLFEKWLDYFPKCLYCFTFPSAVYKGFDFCTALSCLLFFKNYSQPSS